MFKSQLSICIATRNRGNFIADTLNSIAAQLTKDIEIIIVDGASTDNTEEVLQTFTSRFPDSIHYFKETENSGVDGDYDKALGYASGKYCWLMTDDDLLVDGAINYLLPYLQQEFDLLLVNTIIKTQDLKNNLENSKFNISCDTIFEKKDKDDFFKNYAGQLSYIGSVIIKRDIWLSRNRSDYYGTLFVHVGVIFQNPVLESIKVISKPIIILRAGNANWSPRWFEIWMFKWPKLLWSFENYSDQTKACASMQFPWMDVGKLLFTRAVGAYSFKEYNQFFSGKVGIFNRIKLIFIALIPANITNLICVIYVYLFKNKMKMSEQLYYLVISKNRSSIVKYFSSY